jgi:hypothetical protein
MTRFNVGTFFKSARSSPNVERALLQPLGRHSGILRGELSWQAWKLASSLRPEAVLRLRYGTYGRDVFEIAEKPDNLNAILNAVKRA